MFLILGVIGAVLIWLLVGSTLATKGRSQGAVWYQLLAVSAFIVGGVAGSFVAWTLVDFQRGNMAVVLLVHSIVPLIGGAGGAGAVMWWVSRIPPTAAATRRKKERTEYSPFADDESPVPSGMCGHCGQSMLTTAAACPHCKQPRLPI